MTITITMKDGTTRTAYRVERVLHGVQFLHFYSTHNPHTPLSLPRLDVQSYEAIDGPKDIIYDRETGRRVRRRQHPQSE